MRRVVEGGQQPTGSVPRMGDPARVTYLLVDGENIDSTLGSSVLGRRPRPEERPRWERVRTFAERAWDQPVTALFFLNASSGQLPMSFVQALLALDYRPIPLAGDANEKVVDIGIQRTLAAILDRHGDVMLASHDGDFLDGVTALLREGRRVAVLGFPEFVNSDYHGLRAEGLEVHDLEADAESFDVFLPRVRILSLDEFDPVPFLQAPTAPGPAPSRR
jgi:uncharacterized protein